MSESKSTEKTVTFEQLPELRDKTETVSQFLQKQLKLYLDTLRPLLVPRRLLGKYVDAKADVAGADKAFAQLQEKYKEVSQKPFALPMELDKEPLALIDDRLECYPWEYTHEAKGEQETKTIMITAPMRWVLTYRSGYTLAQLRQAIVDKEERRQSDVRQFLVNALVMCSLFDKYPGIAQLFTDLRFQVQVEICPGLGELPLMTISSCLPSFRPADDLILTATRFSGVPAFIELIDMDAVHTLHDPLRQRIEEILVSP